MPHITAENREQVRLVLKSHDFDENDRAVIFWQFGLIGDFRIALWNAIVHADDENLERLRLGFPHEVEGYIRWSRGTLGPRLRAAGLEI